MTTVSFVLFVVLSLALAILSGKQSKSVMEAVEVPVVPVLEEVIIEEGVVDPAIEPLAEGIAATDEAAADEADGETEDVPPPGE